MLGPFASKPLMRRAAWLVVSLPWLAGLAWMAEAAWFLTDDAFISFRYVRNLLEGHGLVFNRGERVEGYSNFLWVLELAALWGTFGIRPEHAAPWLSVAFTAGTIGVMGWWVARLPAIRQRGLVAWMALGFVCSSATFAVWTSGGGLETRQFTFFVVLAVACATLADGRRALLLAASASLAAAALTRPEGPLLAACCFAWHAVQRRAETGRWPVAEAAVLATPCVLVVAAHYLFRYGYYGEWLPNTYYAKHIRPWYEMGWRYFASAALETGLYLLLPLATAALAAAWRRRRGLAYALPLFCVVAHMAYVARVGGDHFEYRPLDFYWPLLAVPAAEGIVLCSLALLRLAKRLLAFKNPAVAATGGVPVGALALFAVALFYANAMQAALLFEGAKVDERIHALHLALDDDNADTLLAAPGMATLNAAAAHLRRQLIQHSIAARNAEHREFAAVRLLIWQPYEGMQRGTIPDDAVAAMSTIGISAFYLPDLTVVDTFGLTDAAVARHPVTTPNRLRVMAHDRRPPPGYLALRGVNFDVYPARREDLPLWDDGRYAVAVGDGWWMPFHAADHQWAVDRFGDRLLTYADPLDPRGNALLHGGRRYVGDRFLLRFRRGTSNWQLSGHVMNHAEHYFDQQRIVGAIGQDFLTSYHPAARDTTTGRAVSPVFTGAADELLSFRIAGGDGDAVGVRLLVDGEQATVWRGTQSERFRRIDHPLAEVAGRPLRLELFDLDTGGWGHIMLDEVLILRPQRTGP